MRTAIGIVRVSQKAGREGDSFVSPVDQRRRIEEACRRDDLRLESVAEEIDVSGGTALERRDGLREAIEAVEAGRVQVVVVAHFDRLFRSITVQAEVVSRIEAAGGEVLALDFGRVTEDTAARWLAGTVMGAFAEYYRRSAAERSKAGQIDAVARGVPPFPSVPVGLRRREDGRLEATDAAPLVAKAVEMRADGETIKAVRNFLAERGIDLTYRQTQGMLSNRLLLGEIHFGELVNLDAHEPIVSRDTFERAQKVRVARGPAGKSDRLLARLGVLRCANCGSRMTVGTVREGTYPFYRCASLPPKCGQRVTVSAAIAEQAVAEVVKRETSDIEGRASVETKAREAEQAAAAVQGRLEEAIKAFADVAGEPVARETIAELAAERDRRREVAEHLGGKVASLALSGADWNRLTLAEKRDLTRAVVRRVDVLPGRGPGRLRFHLFV